MSSRKSSRSSNERRTAATAARYASASCAASARRASATSPGNPSPSPAATATGGSPFPWLSPRVWALVGRPLGRYGAFLARGTIGPALRDTFHIAWSAGDEQRFHCSDRPSPRVRLRAGGPAFAIPSRRAHQPLTRAHAVARHQEREPGRPRRVRELHELPLVGLPRHAAGVPRRRSLVPLAPVHARRLGSTAHGGRRLAHPDRGRGGGARDRPARAARGRPRLRGARARQ